MPIQFLPIPGVQINPPNVDWSPVTNALTNYRQATNEAERWPYQRNALMTEDELRRAQIAQIRQAMAASKQQQELRAGVLGHINSLMNGSDQGAAPPASPMAAAPAQSEPSALGPVTPRSVRLLPIDQAGSAQLPAPGAATAAPTPPAAAAPPAPAQVPDARAYPGTIFSGANAIADWVRRSLPQSAAPSSPQGQPEAPQPPPASRIPLPPAQLGALPVPTLGQEAGPQVRGWLGNEEQPDFVGTPMARGVAPSAQAPAGAQPQVTRAPAPPAAAPAPAAASPQASPSVLGMPLDRARRLAVLLDAAGMRNEFLEKEIANAGAAGLAGERSRAEAIGKAQGEAQNSLPQAVQSGMSMLRNIDAVIDDPYLGYVTGFGSSHFNPWAWTPGTPWSRDTMARIDQVRGQAFLQAFNSLRGGGQITEAEGRKATDALARLQDLSQTDVGYMQALNDARHEVWDVMNLARRKAGQQPIPYVPHRTDIRRLQRIAGDDDYAKLPSGMPFIDPEGNVRTKP